MSENPIFSIIVPTYRRPEALAKLLRAMTCQQYPKEAFEVMVVDDGGGLPLGPVIDPFRGDLDLTLLRQNNAGPAAARNHGALSAKGRFLAFIDDDCTPSPGWVHGLVKVFEQAPGALFGGRTKNALINNIFAETTQALIDYVYRKYKPVDDLGAFFTANNFAVPREEFLQVGGFDPGLRFGEDREFCHRWVSSGRSLVFAPTALVHHAHALNLASFLCLHFHYGRGTVQYKRRCAHQDFEPAKLSPPSYYANLVLSGMRTYSGIRGLLICVLLFMSQVSYAAGYAWEAVKSLGTVGPFSAA